MMETLLLPVKGTAAKYKWSRVHVGATLQEFGEVLFNGLLSPSTSKYMIIIYLFLRRYFTGLRPVHAGAAAKYSPWKEKETFRGAKTSLLRALARVGVKPARSLRYPF